MHVTKVVEQKRSAKQVVFRPAIAILAATSRASGATLPLPSQQIMSRQIQIGQRCRYEQAVRILGQSTVAHFDEAEDALNDPDGMFDLGPHPRLVPVLGPFFRRQITVTAPS